MTAPGLVVTLLNVHRPRDRSHYERFEAYHASFYRAVEATSVTPFSPRAIDRGPRRGASSPWRAPPLLFDPSRSRAEEAGRATRASSRRQRSLRDVEPSVNLVIRRLDGVEVPESEGGLG
jgi:hypothetical protein